MQRTKRLLVIGHENRTREMFKGIRAYCRLHGQWEFHWEGDSSPNVVGRLQLAIHNWKASGIIGALRSDALLRVVRRSGRPVVNLSGWKDLDLPAALSDSVAVGKMAARHFLDNGFHNFGFCAQTVEVYVQKMRSGFVGELAEAGYGCDVFADEFNGRLEANWLRNSRRMDRWLLSLKKPTAILCMYDLRGQEVAMACQRLGLRVPDEVAIVGAGNDESICGTCTPPLSSVDVDLRKIGYESARLLDCLIRGGKAPPKPVLIAPRQVIIRESSNILAIDDPDVSAAVRFIRNPGRESVSVKEILNHVPISRKTLETKFLKILGRTPGEEITSARMEQIKSLLAETDLPMPAVGKKMGFSRSSYFSVFFRREMGMTPTQYRRSRSLPPGENSPHSKGTAHASGGGSPHNPVDSLRTLSREQRQRLNELAASSRSHSRLKPSEMRRILLAMCHGTFMMATNLGEFLHRNPKGLQERFLKPMMDEGLLQRKYPNEPNRPDQAYTAKPQQ